jgi:hypothetical protein
MLSKSLAASGRYDDDAILHGKPFGNALMGSLQYCIYCIYSHVPVRISSAIENLLSPCGVLLFFLQD